MCSSLYCDVFFIAIVQKHTHNISEVCLCKKSSIAPPRPERNLNGKDFHPDRKEISVFCCCCCSLTKPYLTLWDPVECSTPGFPVLHYPPEFAHILVHWVGDGVQPSHPLLPTSPPPFNLLQHQSLSRWVTSWHQVAKVLGGASVSTSLLPMSVWGCFPLGLMFDFLVVQGILKSLR